MQYNLVVFMALVFPGKIYYNTRHFYLSEQNQISAFFTCLNLLSLYTERNN